MTVAGPATEFLERLDAVEARLAEHARRGVVPGLTDADPKTGERWDAGQVWAHLAEFLPYWMREVRMLTAQQSPEPVPFGRTKEDPQRIAHIEAHRHEPPEVQMQRLRQQVAEVRDLTQSLSERDWQLRGVHKSLGVMEMPRIFDEFLVGHLEQHLRQLEGLGTAAR